MQHLPLSCPTARNTGGKVEPTRKELSQKSDQIQPNKFEPTYWNVSRQPEPNQSSEWGYMRGGFCKIKEATFQINSLINLDKEGEIKGSTC